MSHPEQADIAGLIEALLAGGVEFIVVGGAAAVLHGAPITTQDLDIVPERGQANVERLAVVTDGQSTIRVVGLPTLIEIKQHAARPKDRLVLPVLLAILDDSEGHG